MKRYRARKPGISPALAAKVDCTTPSSTLPAEKGNSARTSTPGDGCQRSRLSRRRPSNAAPSERERVPNAFAGAGDPCACAELAVIMSSRRVPGRGMEEDTGEPTEFVKCHSAVPDLVIQ